MGRKYHLELDEEGCAEDVALACFSRMIWASLYRFGAISGMSELIMSSRLGYRKKEGGKGTLERQ